MAELAEYERLGDLDAPFALSTKHHHAQRELKRIREAVCCDIPSLTYEEYRSGTPCPGCGRPYLDDEPWEFRGIVHISAQERSRYEAEKKLYTMAHHDCGAHRHSASGSLTTHCGSAARRLRSHPPRSIAYSRSLDGRRRHTS